MKTKPKKDVVIYEIESGKVDTIAGKDLVEGGHFTPSSRLNTVLPRLNDRYDASIVPAGVYKVGDILKKKDR
jgi:hypothetical protein